MRTVARLDLPNRVPENAARNPASAAISPAFPMLERLPAGFMEGQLAGEAVSSLGPAAMTGKPATDAAWL